MQVILILLMFSKKDIQALILLGLFGPFALPLIAIKEMAPAPKPVKKPPFNPIKVLMDPVRTFMKNSAAKKKLQEGGFTEEQILKLSEEMNSKAKEQNLVYVFIKAINFDEKNEQKEDIIMAGGFPRTYQITKILQILRRKLSYLKDQSTQFFCNKKMISLNTRLENLPVNALGVAELYLVNMETFG